MLWVLIIVSLVECIFFVEICWYDIFFIFFRVLFVLDFFGVNICCFDIVINVLK